MSSLRLSPLAGLIACAVSHTFIQLSSSAIGLALAFRRFFQAIAGFRANIGNAIPQRKVCFCLDELNLWMPDAPSTIHVGYPFIPERLYQLLRSAVSPDHSLRNLYISHPILIAFKKSIIFLKIKTAETERMVVQVDHKTHIYFHPPTASIPQVCNRSDCCHRQ